MMRTDAHQHFWVYDQREYAWIDDSMASLRRDFLPNDLKPELERNGLQGSVVLQERQTLEETRWLLELATDASFVLGVVGCVDLRSPDIRSQLEALAENPKHSRRGRPGNEAPNIFATRRCRSTGNRWPGNIPAGSDCLETAQLEKDIQKGVKE
jgi:predicted TIM-barrel fold metal-dependent hydrolase